MKVGQLSVYLLFCFLLFTSGGNKINPQYTNECPPEGSAKSPRLQELNRLKNRLNGPHATDFNPAVTLTLLLKSGEDRTRWHATSAAKIKGYVKDVKVGGIESANCKAKEKSLRDTHIELILDPLATDKNKCFIAEITPGLRKIMAGKGEDWSTPMIRSKYLGRWVEIEGWLLFDHEHANSSENTNPGNIKNWRGTAWEIHPMTGIKVVPRY